MMKAIVLLLAMIVAVSANDVEVKEARYVELQCDKAEDCLIACNLVFSPSHIRDENHIKYQAKHTDCIRSVAQGTTCEKNQQIRDCFIKDEPEVGELEDEEMASYTIYWHETFNVRK